MAEHDPAGDRHRRSEEREDSCPVARLVSGRQCALDLRKLKRHEQALQGEARPRRPSSIGRGKSSLRDEGAQQVARECEDGPARPWLRLREEEPHEGPPEQEAGTAQSIRIRRVRVRYRSINSRFGPSAGTPYE